MRAKAFIGLLALCLILGSGGSALAGWVTWDNSQDPPMGSSKLPDGSPLSNSYPCEIYNLKILADVTGRTYNSNGSLATAGVASRFKFEIDTNFGSYAQKAKYGTSSYYWDERSHFPNFTIQDCPAGDLYIRLRSRTGASDIVYGLTLEARNDTQTSVWGHRMTDLYSVTPATANDLYSVTAGTLYGKAGTQPFFATGTWEGYGAWATNEAPPMVTLPGVQYIETEPAITRNLYPSLMLTGTAVTTPTVQVNWLNDSRYSMYNLDANGNPISLKDACDGYWQVGTDLSPLNLNVNLDNYAVDVWWTMMCGNDGIMARAEGLGSYGEEVIPLPGSLLLCGIGVGFAALVRGLRRRFHRS